MSKFSLFGGRFDHDPADSFYTDRDGPEGPECPFCNRPARVRRDGSLCCDNCEMDWKDAAEMDIDRAAVAKWPPEVEA